MKILLINPPYTLEERYGKGLKHFGGHAEPLGLAYLAAVVKNEGYQIEILDASVNNYTAQFIADKVKSEKIDIVGITLLTPMYAAVKLTTSLIRKNSPRTIIIIGGVHATALPEETLKDMGNDIVVFGEGEHTFKELIHTIAHHDELKDVKGICFYHKGAIKKNSHREFETNLDNFPPPARELLPMDKYFLTSSRVKGEGFCRTVIVSRGCPFNCSYCSHPFGRSFRAHSPARIISEIEELVSKYKATQINLEADTLTVNKPFVTSLCDALIESKLNKKIKWTCESRLDTINEHILVRMKQAGCWQISVGIESGVDRLLKIINKGKTTQLIEEKIQLIHKVGISIRAFFMLGIPDETPQESLQTIRFAKKLNPDWAQFTITMPYPGTPLFEDLKNKGEIKSFNWEDYKTWGGLTEGNLPFVPKGRTINELKHLQKYALKSFYLRPNIFFKLLRYINSWKILKKYFIGFLFLLKPKQ